MSSRIRTRENESIGNYLHNTISNLTKSRAIRKISFALRNSYHGQILLTACRWPEGNIQSHIIYDLDVAVDVDLTSGSIRWKVLGINTEKNWWIRFIEKELLDEFFVKIKPYIKHRILLLGGKKNNISWTDKENKIGIVQIPLWIHAKRVPFEELERWKRPFIIICRPMGSDKVNIFEKCTTTSEGFILCDNKIIAERNGWNKGHDSENAICVPEYRCEESIQAVYFDDADSY